MNNQGKFINYTEKTITKEGLENSSAWIVPKNSILYSIYASVGFIAINNINLSTSQAIYSIILKDNVDINYIYYYLQNLKKNIHKYIETGTQGNLNSKIVQNFNIKIPSLNEQKRIGNFLSLIDEKIELLEKRYEILLNIKKFYLNVIFNKFLENHKYQIFTLGEISDKLENGYSGNQVPYKTKFPVTRIESISTGKINYNKVGYVKNINECYRLKKGDLLLSNINSLKHIGKTVYFEDRFPLYHGMNLILIRINKKFNSRYIYYYIIFHQNWFKKMACQAVNQASINQKSLKKFKIKIPERKIQNQIEKLLYHFDLKIKINKNRINEYKQFKKGLLQKMFV